MLNGIIEIDVHGKNVESAIEEIRKHLNNVRPSVYRIRIIHGYHGGTRIREGIRDEFSYGREPKVKRITMGDNQGITELVLREFLKEQHQCKYQNRFHCGQQWRSRLAAWTGQ